MSPDYSIVIFHYERSNTKAWLPPGQHDTNLVLKCDPAYFLSRLPFWNIQYNASIPFIHGFSDAADICCITLRDEGSSHLKNWIARRRKCIKSAPPTLRHTKYKCKSRCEKKQLVFSVLFLLCWPSGFLLLRTLIIYKDGAFQGELAASCIIHREREAAAACFKRKQSGTVRTPKNAVHSHQSVRW